METQKRFFVWGRFAQIPFEVGIFRREKYIMLLWEEDIGGDGVSWYHA